MCLLSLVKFLLCPSSTRANFANTFHCVAAAGATHNEFLPDYLEVMKTRKQRLNISHVHFNPSNIDVVVSGDGLVIVLAGAFFAYYRDSDLTAINLGHLGQMIGTRFIQRYSPIFVI